MVRNAWQFVLRNAFLVALTVWAVCLIAATMYGLTLVLISMAIGYLWGPIGLEGIAYLAGGGIASVLTLAILVRTETSYE